MTAEAAMVLPLLLAVTAAMTWLLVVGLAQLRATDAAREAARVLARGESPAVAEGLVSDVGPEGAVLRTSAGGGTVVVTVTATVRGPGGLLAHLPGADVHAEATAALEDAGGASGPVPVPAP
ncbi:TadE family protein [Nocardioides bruguierae]|uniref:TadE family protein n=1 Tax=Nocardioides bruguierae TaxID=2945102 RepID=UPI0020220751|nr:TadE family protein [Nocardioides bruguierae]MCL8027479.1 pilus assembly protein [Nocardioides bruguierae]